MTDTKNGLPADFHLQRAVTEPTSTIIDSQRGAAFHDRTGWHGERRCAGGNPGVS